MKGLIKAVVFSLLPSFALAGVLNAANPNPRGSNICGKTNAEGPTTTTMAAETSSKCLSFGYGGKECMLFSVALADNFDADSNSADTYYDRGCSILGPQPIPALPLSLRTSSGKTSATSKVIPPTSRAQASSTSPSSIIRTTAPFSVASNLSTAKALTTSTSQASTFSTMSQSNSRLSSSTSTSTASTSAVSYYPGCKASDFTQTFNITSLFWFNSTNNLDCVNGKANFDSSARVCVDTSTNTICDPSKTTTSTCTCQEYCTPSAPSAAFQPPGYGPPDTMSISIADFAYPACRQSNPQTPASGIGALGLAEIGDGNVGCGPNHNYLNFFGDSNPGREQGRILFIPGASCQGHLALYEATFPLSCVRDTGGNATCVPKTIPITISLTRFAVGQCNSCSGSLIQ